MLDQTCDVFVTEPRLQSLRAITGRADEHRSKIDLGEMQPLLNCVDGAGLVARTAANLDLAPAGLGVERQKRALVKNINPSARVRCVVLAVIEADNLGPPETARISQ